MPGGRPHDVVFAGMYFRDKHPERARADGDRPRPAREFGLHIFARNGTDDRSTPSRRSTPPHIVGALPYEQMLAAYKMYKVFLNVNSVTRLADHVRPPGLRAVGLLDTPVVSGWSRAHRGDLRRARSPIARDEPEQTTEALRPDQQPRAARPPGPPGHARGLRQAPVHATASTSPRPLGRPVDAAATRSISVVLPTNRPEQLEHAIAQVARADPPAAAARAGPARHLDIDPVVVADKARAAGISDVVVLPPTPRSRWARASTSASRPPTAS